MDQGKTLLTVYNLWQDKKISLIGPEASIQNKYGQAFFHGPWVYYLPLPALLAFNWQPLVSSYTIIILNLAGLLLVFKPIKKSFGKETALIYSGLLSLTPILVSFSQFIWNPNLLIFTSLMIIFTSLKILDKKEKYNLNFWHLLAGFFLGFGLGNHYVFAIMVLSFFIWIVIKKTKLVNITLTVMGFLIGFSPLLLFELRHNFYNLNTIISILKNGSSTAFSFPLPLHYYLSFLPFLLLLLAYLLKKLFEKQKIITLGLIAVFTVYSVIEIFVKPATGYTMPENWNYKDIEKTSKIILRENKTNYNIANIIQGDTRAYALRYLLTKANNPPLSVENYPNASFLFVISKQKKDQTEKIPTWEVSSFCPCKWEKTWKINEEVFLHLFSQQTKD